MLVNMILMHVMKMAVVEVIDMALMADRRMSAVGTVPVAMAGMMLFVAGCHSAFLSSLCWRSGEPAVIAFRQHAKRLEHRRGTPEPDLIRQVRR
jgi:hypothetical protein